MVEKQISMSQLNNFVFKIKRFSKVEKEISISQLVKLLVFKEEWRKGNKIANLTVQKTL